jgi:hypothetical protein
MLLEEAHGICAVAVPGFRKLDSSEIQMLLFFWGLHMAQ